jgi:hypothetical protein
VVASPGRLLKQSVGAHYHRASGLTAQEGLRSPAFIRGVCDFCHARPVGGFWKGSKLPHLVAKRTLCLKRCARVGLKRTRLTLWRWPRSHDFPGIGTFAPAPREPNANATTVTKIIPNNAPALRSGSRGLAIAAVAWEAPNSGGAILGGSR